MKEYINAYLNTISESFENDIELNKIIQQEIKKGYTVRKFYDNLIFEQQEDGYWSYEGNNGVKIQFKPDGTVNVTGGQEVDVTNGSRLTKGQLIKMNDQLRAELQQYKEKKKVADSKTMENARKGFGETVWESLKDGAAIVCDAAIWVLETPTKLVSWPLKELASVIKTDNITPYTPEKSEIPKIKKELAANAKTPDEKQLNKLKKFADFYKTLLNAAPGTIMYENTTKRIWAKNNKGAIVVIDYQIQGWAGASAEQQGQAINQALDDATKNGIKGDGSGLTAQQQAMLQNNSQVKSAMNRLKLRDKKSKGGFFEMIIAWFSKLFGGGDDNEYEEYTLNQLMDFTPYIKALVKKGTLPPGKYSFEYKG